MADYTGMPGHRTMRSKEQTVGKPVDLNVVPGNPPGEERRDIRYIRDVLWPEFLRQFIEDNAEYPEERPLGERAEWHGMHRKVGKLQAPVWDGTPWTGRESIRRMFQEIIGHAFLAIASIDYRGANCSRECGESHTYGVGCAMGKMLRKPSDETPLMYSNSVIRPNRLDLPAQEPHVERPLGVPGLRVTSPADETEAYMQQRRLRTVREVRAARDASRPEETDREAAAWRVRHCGPGCAYGHRYSGDCMNDE